MTVIKIVAAAAATLLSVSVATAATYSASSAFNDAYGLYGDGHSLYLNGQTFGFGSTGTFVDNGGSASLTGTASTNGGADGFVVNMSFNSFTTPGPKLELASGAYTSGGGSVDPSTWSFWDVVEGGVSTIMGFGAYAGWDFNVISKPVSEAYGFQSGMGANGKNVGLGLSGWLFLDGQSVFANSVNPCARPASGMGNVCDFNVDLNPVPLPAPALMLIGGLAALGGLRRSRRKTA